MKKTQLAFFLFILLQQLQAQMITHESINSVGGFYSNATAMLTFSEGVVIDEFILEAPSLFQATRSLPIPRISPNPATVDINVQTLQSSIIDLLDVSGKVIQTVLSDGERTLVNVSGCKKGIYLIRVRSLNGVWVEKLIKK